MRGVFHLLRPPPPGLYNNIDFLILFILFIRSSAVGHSFRLLFLPDGLIFKKFDLLP